MTDDRIFKQQLFDHGNYRSAYQTIMSGKSNVDDDTIIADLSDSRPKKLTHSKPDQLAAARVKALESIWNRGGEFKKWDLNHACMR